MIYRSSLIIKAAITLGLAAFLATPAVPQGPKKVLPPAWSHAFDLRCRTQKQPKFDKDTKSFGIEVFRDDNNGKGIYIIETGDVGAVAHLKDFKGNEVKSRAPEFLRGHDLKVRPAGVSDFSKARVFGLEVYRDDNAGNLIYLSEAGAFGVAPGARGGKATNLKHVHGLDFKVRHAGEKSFEKAKVVSVEVYLDESTGCLVYITESGMLAVAPANSDKEIETPTPNPKAPQWLHGLDLKVRKGGEQDFEQTTKSYGLEVFRDENNGNLVYLSEIGSIAVVPNKQDLKAPTPESKLSRPVWTHGLDLKCRKAGQKDFTKETPNYGIEVFNDDNTGCVIYICETGAITAIPKK